MTARSGTPRMKEMIAMRLEDLGGVEVRGMG